MSPPGQARNSDVLPAVIRALPWVVAALAVLRLATLGAYPLMDTTEARYAEIARKMAETGTWATPLFDYGIPFWGKPPLSFWLIAGSFKALGTGEFSARLPQWLAGVLAAALLWQWLAARSRREAVYAVAILLGSALYLVATGAVLTDTGLVLGTTIAMRGFWQGLHGARREGWLLFAGIGVGLLAKGPVAAALIMMPLTAWAAASGSCGMVWRRLPWIRGSLLAGAIALPWYAIAELRTPGFLEYFLLGEHWQRFVVPGWKGDLYGNAHHFPRGAIWAFALAAAMPWTVVLPAAWTYLRRGGAAAGVAGDARWRWYLLCWALAPCIFFSLAGNILWTYVLPGLPAMAALAAAELDRFHPARVGRVLIAGLALSALGLAGFLANVELRGREQRDSAKTIVADYRARRQGDEPLIFLGRRPFSAAFYSAGSAQLVRDAGALRQRLEYSPAFVAIEAGTAQALPDSVRQRLRLVRDYGRFELYGPARPAIGTSGGEIPAKPPAASPP